CGTSRGAPHAAAFAEAARYLSTMLAKHAPVSSSLLLDASFVAGAVVGVAGLLLLFARAHWGLSLILVVTVAVGSAIGARQSNRFVQVNYESSPRLREFGYWPGLLS